MSQHLVDTCFTD